MKEPDELNNRMYAGTEGNVPPYIAELDEQLRQEVDRLSEMMKTSLCALRDPTGYADGYRWIKTTDKYGERSEFSMRLAKARALFEALIALQETAGVEQIVPDRGGPDPANKPKTRWQAWAIVHNSHGPVMDTIVFMPAGDRPETDEEWVRCPWMDGFRYEKCDEGNGKSQ